MSTQVEKFDPSTLMQGVKDRIKATFVSLIPDDQWEQMVKNEVANFFKEHQRGQSQWISDFGSVVNDICRKRTEEKVLELLNDPDFQIEWMDNKQKVSDAMKKMIIDRAPELFATAIESLVAQTIDRMKQRY